MTTKKKITDPLAGIAGLNPLPPTSYQAEQQPPLLPTFEYAIGLLKKYSQRNSYIIATGNGGFQTLGASTSGSDVAVGTVTEDGILMTANISAATASNPVTTFTATNSVYLRIYRQINGAPVEIYRLSCAFGLDQRGTSVSDNPQIILYAGDSVKIGRYLNLPVNTEIDINVCCVIQPFR